jgi:hypothetical protein
MVYICVFINIIPVIAFNPRSSSKQPAKPTIRPYSSPASQYLEGMHHNHHQRDRKSASRISNLGIKKIRHPDACALKQPIYTTLSWSLRRACVFFSRTAIHASCGCLSLSLSQSKSRSYVDFCLMYNPLNYFLLGRVQIRSKGFVKLWLFLLEFCNWLI